MIREATDPLRIQGLISVMGAPRFGRGARRRALDGQGLLVVDVETTDLVGRAFPLEPPRRGIGFGRRGPRLGGGEAAAGPVEGVPPKPQAMGEQDKGRRSGDGQGRPCGGTGRPQDAARDHGKAFRSSSKCGPSRSRGQSPPQTIGVPCRAAAALKAAAMRG